MREQRKRPFQGHWVSPVSAGKACVARGRLARYGLSPELHLCGRREVTRADVRAAGGLPHSLARLQALGHGADEKRNGLLWVSLYSGPLEWSLLLLS